VNKDGQKQEKEMNIISSIGAWLRGRADRHRAKRRAVLEWQSRIDIQVKEYDGELYFAYEGIPLLRVGRIGMDAVEALRQARATYVDYQQSKE